MNVMSHMLMAGVVAAAFLLAPPETRAQSAEDRALHAERSMVRALTHMRVARYDEAVQVYQEALRVNPQHPALLVGMADAQVAAGDPGAGLFYIGQAVALDSMAAPVLTAWRDIALQAGNMQEALSASTQLVARTPDAASAWESHLLLLERLDQTGRALALDAELEARFPRNVALLRLRADHLEKAGRTEALVPVLERLLPVDPVEVRLARAHMRLGNTDRAAELWERALPNEEAQANLEALAAGSVLAGGAETGSGGQPGGGAEPAGGAAGGGAEPDVAPPSPEEIRDRVQTDPRQIDLWVQGVRAFSDAGRYMEAAELGEDGLLLYPFHGPMTLATAPALVALGHAERARGIVEAALKRSRPDDPWTAPLQELLAGLDDPQ